MEKKKILIIEDERDVAKVLAARLKIAGYDIMVAIDGVQGVQFTHIYKPDLIILDLKLPAGDGLSVLENLRLSAYAGSIPVVVLTGIKDEECKNKVMEKGVDAYFEKPYNPEELISAIRNILNAQ